MKKMTSIDCGWGAGTYNGEHGGGLGDPKIRIGGNCLNKHYLGLSEAEMQKRYNTLPSTNWSTLGEKNRVLH
jgi:hypothetical protein